MSTLTFRLGWPLYAGMAVAGAAAVVASASTLSTLARLAGWQSWTPWLLPAALDIGGSAGGWCWLRPGVPEPARRFGRIVALAGATGTLLGNAAGHLMSTGYLSPGPVLVVIVGALPAAVLVVLAHLAALLTTSTPHAPGTDGPVAGDARSEEVESSVASLAEEHDPGTDEDGDEPAPGDVLETRDAVLHLIQQHPSTIAELAQATGRSRTTVIGHLTALTSTGAIHRDSSKRYRARIGPHLVSDSSQESMP